MERVRGGGRSRLHGHSGRERGGWMHGEALIVVGGRHGFRVLFAQSIVRMLREGRETWALFTPPAAPHVAHAMQGEGVTNERRRIKTLTGRCCMKSRSTSMSSSVRSVGSFSRHSRTVSRTISDCNRKQYKMRYTERGEAGDIGMSSERSREAQAGN
jgi:hypothetical protein